MTRVPGLSRSTVDRDAGTRDDPEALARAWERARVLVVEDGTAAVLEQDRPRLVLVASADAPQGDRLYLGTDDDGPVFAVAGQAPRRPGARLGAQLGAQLGAGPERRRVRGGFHEDRAG